MEIRNVIYYKTTKPLIFNDGFEVQVGTKVQFNYAEGQIYNVEFTKNNEKRIFWVHSSELLLYKTVKEKWLKKDIEEHNIDLNDKWFEYEKERIAQSKNSGKHTASSKNNTGRTAKALKRKTGTTIEGERSKLSPKSSIKPGKSENKVRVSTTNRKKTATKRATTNSKKIK